jgi:CubicO group peptidase (beta-lactamase class C family)
VVPAHRRARRLRLSAAPAALALLAVLGGCAPRPPVAPPAPDYWPTAGWRHATPESQGIDSAALAATLAAAREQGLAIHSLQIVRHGYVVLDAYFYPFARGQRHDLASVTKTVTATLVGIAHARGRLASLEQPLLELFPERRVGRRAADKAAIRVRDLLAMASGLDCGYRSDPAELAAMHASADWVQHALELPLAARPGTRFAYCSPGSHLLSAVVSRATGANARAFAERELFAPLGIRAAHWPADAHGVTHGWGDLALEPLDAARLGLLYLHDGVWDGARVLARDWVHAATRAQLPVPGGDEGYGYGWWIPGGALRGAYEARGHGGQSITVWPAQDLVAVMTGGGFDRGRLAEPLLAAVKSAAPLPENPDAFRRLQALVAEVARAPAPGPVTPLPPAARRVSGREYALAPNALELEALALRFEGGAEARLAVTRAGGRYDLAVGLDGVYRFSARGPRALPVAVRGTWDGERDFVIDYDAVGGIDRLTIRLQFAGDTLTAYVSDRVSGTYSGILRGRARR